MFGSMIGEFGGAKRMGERRGGGDLLPVTPETE